MSGGRPDDGLLLKVRQDGMHVGKFADLEEFICTRCRR